MNKDTLDFFVNLSQDKLVGLINRINIINLIKTEVFDKTYLTKKNIVSNSSDIYYNIHKYQFCIFGTTLFSSLVCCPNGLCIILGRFYICINHNIKSNRKHCLSSIFLDKYSLHCFLKIEEVPGLDKVPMLSRVRELVEKNIIII